MGAVQKEPSHIRVSWALQGPSPEESQGQSERSRTPTSPSLGQKGRYWVCVCVCVGVCVGVCVCVCVCVCVRALSLQLCSTLCDPMDCTLGRLPCARSPSPSQLSPPCHQQRLAPTSLHPVT